MSPVIVRKISKTIELKEKEHDEMRNKFLKLIQTESGQDPEPTPGETDQGTNQNLRGNKDVSVLSMAEWNTLVGI